MARFVLTVAVVGEVMTFAPADRSPDSDTRAARALRRSEAPMQTRILVVDDDQNAATALDLLLRQDGFMTSIALDGKAALAEARRTRLDVVLTDMDMPGIDGAELCRRLRAIDADLPVIVTTAHSGTQSVLASLRAGAEDFLVKPLEYGAVLWCVERAVARCAEKRDRAELQRTLNERLVLSSIREQEFAEVEAKHREQLSALLENLNDGVIIAEKDGHLMMINEVARTILDLEGEAPRTVEALHAREILDLKKAPLESEQRPLARALRGECFTDYEVLYAMANGELRRVASTGTSVKAEDGSVELAIVVLRDVTRLRRLEQQREEYLALVSHDLRDPLSSIIACSFMLKESMTQKGLTKEANLAERAERNVTRMGSMLDELTEATAMESQGLELHPVASDLRQTVANAVDRLDDNRARRISVEADDTSSLVVFADASLERVVANLLTNAL
jgi:PAS domain S-box-containing protein